MVARARCLRLEAVWCWWHPRRSIYLASVFFTMNGGGGGILGVGVSSGHDTLVVPRVSLVGANRGELRATRGPTATTRFIKRHRPAELRTRCDEKRSAAVQSPRRLGTDRNGSISSAGLVLEVQKGHLRTYPVGSVDEVRHPHITCPLLR